MKKKLMALLLCLVMVVTTLAACGGGNDGGNADGGNADGGNADAGNAGGGVKASVFWYEESDVYLSSVRTALDKELKAAGIEFDNQFASNDQAKQIDQIKTAIAGGSNLLIVNIVTSGAPDTAQDIIDIAGDIPVIFFNRAIGTDGSDVEVLKDNANACFIGTDAPEAGHMQGKMIGEYLVENFDTVDVNGDGIISYAMMKGQEGNVEAEFRTLYSVEDANKILTAAGKSALQYFDTNNKDCYQVDQNGEWSAKAAKEYMDTNFVTYNEDNNNMIELVICNNDGMAEGVVASLWDKGYNKGDAHVVPVFGVDATENAVALINEGAMIGTVKQDAEGMAAAITQTAKAIAGGAAPVDALAGLNDDRFSVASDCNAKLFVAYAPYTK